MYEKCIQNFGREREGKKLRCRRRWEDDKRMDRRKEGGKVWTGYTWLKVGTSGGPL